MGGWVRAGGLPALGGGGGGLRGWGVGRRQAYDVRDSMGRAPPGGFGGSVRRQGILFEWLIHSF